MPTYRIKRKVPDPSFKEVLERVRREMLGIDIEKGTYQATMMIDSGVHKELPVNLASVEADMLHAHTMSQLLHLPRTLWL